MSKPVTIDIDRLQRTISCVNAVCDLLASSPDLNIVSADRLATLMTLLADELQASVAV